MSSQWPPPGSPDEPNPPASGQPPYPPSQDPGGQDPGAWPYGQPPAGPPYGQPPYGQPPTEPPGQWTYPHQDLSDQQVVKGRNRTPLLIGLGLLVVLAVAGVVAWLLLRDNGEDNRAAYCSALRELANDGSLSGIGSDGDASAVDQVQHVIDLAPDAVAGDWRTLSDLAKSATAGSIDPTDALRGVSALRAITSDARDNCDLTIDIPF